MSKVGRQQFKSIEISQLNDDPAIGQESPTGSFATSVVSGDIVSAYKVGAGDLQWKRPRFSSEEFEDFLLSQLSATDSRYAIIGTTSGLGSSVSLEGAVSNNNHHGLVTITGGLLGGTALVNFFNGNNKLRIIDEMVFEFRVRIPTLSTGGQSFVVRFGMGDTTAPANGFCFSYTHSTGGGNWQCLTVNGSTTTTIDAGINVSANTWYKLKARINTPKNEVKFFIDDILIATSTTNIPTSSTNVRPIAYLQRTNLLQIGSSDADVDYVYWKVTR